MASDSDVVDVPRRRRRGPEPLAAEARRTHTVSSYLSDAELALLDQRRAMTRMRRGEYLRVAALGRLPPVIPEINREAWVELARVGGNLHQLTRYLNARAARGDVSDPGDLVTPALAQSLAAEIAECRRLLSQVRNDLIGAGEK